LPVAGQLISRQAIGRLAAMFTRSIGRNWLILSKHRFWMAGLGGLSAVDSRAQHFRPRAFGLNEATEKPQGFGKFPLLGSHAETIAMLLSEILGAKGRMVHTCSPEDTLADVVELMVGHNIGSLVVLKDGEMVGIITERDILRASAATRGSLEFAQVHERMTRCPIVASPQDDLPDVMGVMTERRIRHLPVVERGQLIGIISIGDLVKAQHDELSRENHYLKSYIQS
jgi:CBS domain-containing protein